MVTPRLSLSILSVIAVIALAPPASCSTYTITDLGTLGGTSSTAFAVNSSGYVTGYSTTAEGTSRPFIWDPTTRTMTNLGTIGISGGADDLIPAWGYDINESGTVTGTFTSYRILESFVYDGSMTQLPVSLNVPWGVSPWLESGAQGINDLGTVTGYLQQYGSSHAYICYSDGTWSDINPSARDWSRGVAVNESNQVAGYSYGAAGEWVSWVYTPGEDVTWIGGLGAYYNEDGSVWHYLGTQTWDINDSGQVTGYSSTWENGLRAFLWTADGGMTDLGSLAGAGGSSVGFGINNAGEVVGWSNIPSWGMHAMLWDDGQMYDLNDFLPADSGWDYLETAEDISDGGHIVGYGFINGQRHAYLMTVVPAPASLTLASMALAALALARRRMR